MKASDLKYLIAYVTPISAGIGLYVGGIWSFGAIYVAFIILPLLELITPNNGPNHRPEEESERSVHPFFDIMLYLNFPLLFVLLGIFLYKIHSGGLSGLETVGMTFNIGLVLGSMGINVAHELGHRTGKTDQIISKIMLMPSLYMHFFIEHNRGHHKHVGTYEDPATARYGESLYKFIFRSVIGSYQHAWILSNQQAQRKGYAVTSLQNEMVHFTIIQLVYLAAVAILFSPVTMLAALVAAIIGFSFLEMVNYIEHYGLMRKRLPNGRYEHVDMQHSWNSNHSIGRIFLYELTRHADHHAKATRKYQILKHIDESPQLPTGYPGSMIISLFPPLWFRMMNHRVADREKALTST